MYERKISVKHLATKLNAFVSISSENKKEHREMKLMVFVVLFAVITLHCVNGDELLYNACTWICNFISSGGANNFDAPASVMLAVSHGLQNGNSCELICIIFNR